MVDDSSAKQLSRQQIEQYHEQGYVAPIDVMDESEADAYLQRLQAAEAEHPDQLNAENRNNAHLAFSFLDELVHHRLILDAVAVDLILKQGQMSLHHARNETIE
jgi:hypothetical protein